LQQITRKLNRTKYKKYLKIKYSPAKADPTTYFSLFAIPKKHNAFIAEYGYAVAKNAREALSRRKKAKALSAYRVSLKNASYMARLLKLAASAPKAHRRSCLSMIPNVQAMKATLKSGHKQRPATNAPLRDAKRVKLLLRIIDDMDIC
jgi:hypothetical protein